MGYWKCSSNLYMMPIMREINKPIHPRDGFMSARESIFFKLLSFCVDGHVFVDVKQFAKTTALPLKQCQIVWDICIKNTVLREVEDGYSVNGWLIEHNMLGIKANKNHVTSESSENDSKAEEIEQTQPVKQEAESKQVEEHNSMPKENNPNTVKNVRGDNTKFQARPNVYLSYKELDELKAEFSDEEIALMLDRLSDYKTQSNRYYASDYQAIRKWVIKWLDTNRVARHTKGNQKKSENENSNFPTWLTGK